MATQQDIEAMYDWVDTIHELRLGKFADFTAAYYDGDFSKSLAQAQKDKHDWIFDGVGVTEQGKKILDIGSGWGPVLNAARERGSTGVGLTLSSAQQRYCTREGLTAQLRDWKKVNPSELGTFDAVISVGAFAHFCSEEEYTAGKREEGCTHFFDFCADSLPLGGRLYLQTMVWGTRVPVSSEIRLDATEGSPEQILARMRKFYPGSWLPSSKEQMLNLASNRFKFIKSSNGRNDYIETLNGWTEGTKNLWKFPTIFKSLLAFAQLAPRYLTDPDFRVQIESVMKNDQQECFIQEIMTHERMFFERIA